MYDNLNTRFNSNYSSLFFLFILMMIGGAIASVIQFKLGFDMGTLHDSDESVWGYLVSVFSFQLFTFLAPTLIWLYFWRKKISPFVLQKLNIQRIGLVVVVFVLVYFVANTVNYYTDFFLRTRDSDFVSQMDTQLEVYTILFQREGFLIFNILIIGFLPAIAEEFFFRLILFRFLVHKNKSFWVSAVLSSFLFAIVHFQVTQLLPIFLMGIILSYSYYVTGRIFVPIVLHALNNSVQVLLFYFSVDSTYLFYWEFALPILVFCSVYVVVNYKHYVNL